MHPERKEKLRKTFWLLVLFGIILLSYHILIVEPNNLAVRRINVDIGLNGPVKIVFISDIHIETTSDYLLENVIKMANSEQPDYILLGGDYTDRIDYTAERLAPLENLNSRKGIYTVLGNHDYYLNEMVCYASENETAVEITDFLESKGIQVLRNEKIETEDFILVGLDDSWACKTDYEKATENMDFSDPNVLLLHNQEAISENELKKWNLVLVGHTHCGQVRFPIIGSVLHIFGITGKYEMGHHEFENGKHIYTNCGLGGGARLLNPPEITVIELS